MFVLLVKYLMFVATTVETVTAREFTDEEYSQFPRLYHLDEYKACLGRTGGLYCLGTFYIEPPKQPEPLYNLLKEYSEDPYNFNRTQLHRGYCVSARCPSSERNNTLRFERCAAQWGRKRKLRLSLKKLTYCRTHAQEYTRARGTLEPHDLSQKIFLAVTALICVANLIGTVYDVAIGEVEKKNKYLTVWSVQSNWRRLIETYEDGDPRLTALAPVQGLRVCLMILVIVTHTGCIHLMLYLENPQYVEKAFRNPFLMLFMNGTAVMMILVVISSFLLSYNLLLISKTKELNMGMLKWCMAKRVARISPVSLLVVGYAATFWPHLSGGPMWPTLVEPESAVCREKFWAHALYVNNLWNADQHCLVQTWFLGTDMQLHVVSCVVTLALGGRRGRRARALRVLAALVVASSALNGVLAYYFDWQNIVYHMYPDTIRTLYKGVPSFYRLYTAPWGSLPACLLGLLLAHLHFTLQERRIDGASYRWFRWVSAVTPAAMVWWVGAGHGVRAGRARELTALLAAAERPALGAGAALCLLAMFHGVPGFLRSFLSWRGWRAAGRLSLAVLMLHWPVGCALAAARTLPLTTSLLDVIVDASATGAVSYSLAVPLTLAVEMPVARLADALLFTRSVAPTAAAAHHNKKKR